MIRKLPVYFSSGALGGFVQAMSFLFASMTGIVALSGMPPAHGWPPELIYRQVVWGGLWSAVFFIRFLDELLVLKGIVFSLLPTLVPWFIFIPRRLPPDLHPGLAGFLLVAFLNTFWGIATVIMIGYLKKADK